MGSDLWNIYYIICNWYGILQNNKILKFYSKHNIK